MLLDNPTIQFGAFNAPPVIVQETEPNNARVTANVLPLEEAPSGGGLWISRATGQQDPSVINVIFNVSHLMRGGRARWKMANETCNTLKNQGYHFEHNYGHGTQHLSVVFATLMLLAFVVDQTQQLCCALFQAMWAQLGSKRRLWERMRAFFYDSAFASMQQLFEALLYGFQKSSPVIMIDST
jgi:hypothetical protein